MWSLGDLFLANRKATAQAKVAVKDGDALVEMVNELEMVGGMRNNGQVQL